MCLFWTRIGIHTCLVGHWNRYYINEKSVLSRSYFDNYHGGTNTFLCDQNKKGKIITIVMYIGLHNQDKPLPAGSLDWIKHPISKLLFQLSVFVLI